MIVNSAGDIFPAPVGEPSLKCSVRWRGTDVLVVPGQPGTRCEAEAWKRNDHGFRRIPIR